MPLLAAALSGCGSASELPAAAEPARSPPLTRAPAGLTIPVGFRPEGVVFDPASGLLAVGIRKPPSLALVDPERRRVVRRVALPAHPRHLQLAPGGVVLVPAERADVLVRVRLPGGETTTTRVGDFPHDATSIHGRTFVGDEFSDTVTVLDGRTSTALPTGDQPGGLAAAGPDGLAVLTVRDRTLEIFDAAPPHRRRARIPVGVGPTHVVSDRRNLLWVVDTRGNAVLQVHLHPDVAITRRTRVPGRPYGVAFDRRRLRVWVTQTERNRIVMLDARRGVRTAASYPTVRQPDTVAVDPRTGRVFVTGKIDGVVQVIDHRSRRTP